MAHDFRLERVEPAAEGDDVRIARSCRAARLVEGACKGQSDRAAHHNMVVGAPVDEQRAAVEDDFDLTLGQVCGVRRRWRLRRRLSRRLA